jgi:hypothetical protein
MLQANLQMDLGIRWDYYFSQDWYHIGLNLGYEYQVWIDQNQFFEKTVTRGSEYFRFGELSLSGLVGGARFDF